MKTKSSNTSNSGGSSKGGSSSAKSAPSKTSSSNGSSKSSSNGSSKSGSNGSSNGSSSASGSKSSNGSLKNSSNGNTKGMYNASQQKAQPGSSEGLTKLFEDMIKDIYWAEKALTKALPKMAKNATSPELITALNDHLAVTQGQVARLEQVFESLGKPPRAKKCEAMEGLVKEAEEIMGSADKGVVRDAGIIAAGQKVEHYEIATYGTLSAWAKILGEDEAMGLFDETLAEEKEADQLLTQVAESSINVAAAEEGDSDSDDSDE